MGWEYNNVVLFEVDENGKYTIIANPKYDDLDNSYFYGDYAAQKIYLKLMDIGFYSFITIFQNHPIK